MPLWFARGLRRGVVTTRYPARPDDSAARLPTPPAFRPGADPRSGGPPGRGVPEPRAERGTTCWSSTWARAPPAAVRRAAPEAVATSGEFELATTSRGTHKSRSRTGGRAMNASRDEAEAARRLRETIAAQFGRSLHIRTLDTGSCAVCEQEIRLLAAPHYDLHRLGFFFTPAPRHADLLMVTGPMIRAFDVAARKTYDAMPGPKVVVATGACALGGVYPGPVRPRHVGDASSRSTCGSPAARPARWRCCRACASRSTGSRNGDRTSLHRRPALREVRREPAGHAVCGAGGGWRAAAVAGCGWPGGRACEPAAAVRAGGAARSRVAAGRWCPATLPGRSRPATDGRRLAAAAGDQPGRGVRRAARAGRGGDRPVRAPLPRARPRHRAVPGRVQPRAGRLPGRARRGRGGHVPGRLGDDGAAVLPAHPAPSAPRRGGARRVLVPGPVRDRVRADHRGVRHPGHQDAHDASWA